MRPIRPVTDMKGISGSFGIATYVLATILIGYFVAEQGHVPTTYSASHVLDLTEKVPAAEQGFPGMPGAGFGGPVGVKDSSRYQLPLEIQILGASARDNGDFTLEVLLRNTGNADFELPSSTNITSVEKPGNKSQRLFFFRVRPVAEKQGDAESIGFAATGGSTSVPNSFLRLGPGETLRVLIPAPVETLKQAFKGQMQQLEARVVCSEWQLEDAHYFIQASSDDAVSKNVIKFVLRDGTPAVLQP
jgi:hypothetical protein